MEKAIFITKVEDMHYVNNSYSRLYFGQEFCERLMPSVASLKQALSYARKKGIDFSLVTPYVTTTGLKKTEELFELLKDKKIECEIIVNDFGVLNLVNRKYQNLTPVLGRLLTKQKRSPELPRLLKREKTKPRFLKDPRNPKMKYLVFQKKMPVELELYYKGSNALSVPIIHDFLIAWGIRRIELDNVNQGLHLELPRDKISASIYLPYVYIATTFFCPTVGCNQKKKSFLKIKPCNQPCQRYVFELRHKSMGRPIYLKGNTQFYKNTELKSEDWQKLGVDRIVYEPTIPI